MANPSLFNPIEPSGIDWQFSSLVQDVTYDVNGVPTFTPTNLTGYTATLQVQDPKTNLAIFALTIGAGITITAPTTGVAIFHATSTQMTLTPGSYPFNVVGTSAGGVKTLWIIGLLTVERAAIV